jgi:hypothetical protein
MKSPLKENINNFRCLRTLKQLIPQGSVVNSWFLFDAHEELSLAEDQRMVISHTNKYIIYEFWDCVLTDPNRMLMMAKDLFPRIRTKNMFSVLQESWTTYHDPYLRATLFFLLNKCSSTGLISCGELDDKNFNPLSLSHLKTFKIDNFHVAWDRDDDFIQAVKKIKNTDYHLFPIGKFNYNLFEDGKNKGHEMITIYHKRFYEGLKDVDKKWIVIYKNHTAVPQLYKDYNIIMLDKYGHPTTQKEKCGDLVIANF